MRALVNLFMEICLLRKGPQDVPASPALLKLTLVSYVLSGLIVMLVSMSANIAVLRTLLDIALLAGLTYGFLRLRGYESRFAQTLTALMGTGTVLGVIALPVVIWISGETAPDGGLELPSLLFLLLLTWSVTVTAHIMRHALSVSRWMGALYALGFVVVSIVLSSLLFPVG